MFALLLDVLGYNLDAPITFGTCWARLQTLSATARAGTLHSCHTEVEPFADISISSAPATTTAIPTEMATLTAAATVAVVAMAVVVVTAAVVEASVVTAAVTACPTLART